MHRIWSPWRHAYVTRADDTPGCVFCIAKTIGDGQQLIVHEGQLAYVILNKFPYNNGHLMIAPYEHAGALDVGAFVEAGENDNLLVQKVTADKGTLGILGFSYLEENADKVIPVQINGFP